MELKQAVKILKDHNAWRRDNTSLIPQPMISPKELGIAIEVIVEHLEENFNKSIIGKIGDKIQWDFKEDKFKDYPKDLRDNVFTAEIAMVDLDEKVYCVYCEYGQDKIPFDNCKLLTGDYNLLKP